MSPVVRRAWLLATIVLQLVLAIAASGSIGRDGGRGHHGSRPVLLRAAIAGPTSAALPEIERSGAASAGSHERSRPADGGPPRAVASGGVPVVAATSSERLPIARVSSSRAPSRVPVSPSARGPPALSERASFLGG